MRKLRDGYLENQIKEAAKRMGVKPPLVLEVKRNNFTASYLGIGNFGIMFVREHLRLNFGYAKVEYIIAHELAHRKENHILKIMLFNILVWGIALYLLKIFWLFSFFFIIITYSIRNFIIACLMA